MDPAAFEKSPVGRLVPIKGHDQRWDEEFEDYAFVPDPLPASLPLAESTYARRSAEVAEVLNYVRATETALERIKERPISFNMIAELQQILVRGTHGDSNDAGRLREHYVLIGPDNCRISEARFIPTPHGDLLRDGVSDWEKWINADDSIPLLVKVAAGHYQLRLSIRSAMATGVWVDSSLCCS
jgi:hypothetical protein